MNNQKEQYKQMVRDLIDDLPEEKIRSILDFIEFIRDKAGWDATREILEDEHMMSDIKEADEALQKGKTSKFISWEKTREDV